MNSNLKTGGVSHADTSRGLYRVAIVGAASLKGKEVAEMIEQRSFPAVDVKLLDDDESLGQLEAIKDEITFIQNVRAEQFDNVDFTFFASDQECTRRNWRHVQKAGGAIVDLSHALEDEPAATVRAPWLQRQLGQVAAPELQPGPAVVAHPASVVLALLLTRLQTAMPVQRAVASVFQPASELGQKGMDELHEQTVNLLSFQPLPKSVYDVQVAFSMVSRYGEQASSPSLSAITNLVVRHYRKIVPENTLVPSVSVLQAPAFHAHTISINIQLDSPADIAAISLAVAGDHVKVVQSLDEAPNNVNAAGQPDILVSVTPDASDPNTAWIWAASDNLRVAAATAVECAEGMAGSRPRGQVQ